MNPLNTHSAPVRRADQRAVRKSNLSLVARRIAEAGALSRAQLAKLTGLNKTTVSSLVAELIERGVVTESGLADGGGVGRPAQILELDDSRIAALGLEINVDYLAVCVCDLRGAVRFRDGRRARQPRRARRRSSSSCSRSSSARRCAECDALGLTPIGAGISVPGTVEAETGTLIHAPNLGWDQLPVVECLRDSLGDPGVHDLRVGNDANLAALGELESGALRGIRHGLLIYGNVGIGGAVIVDGAIFPGSDGFAGEIGHIPVRPFDGERVPLRRPRLPRDARRPGGDRLPGRHPGHAQRDLLAGRRASPSCARSGDPRGDRARSTRSPSSSASASPRRSRSSTRSASSSPARSGRSRRGSCPARAPPWPSARRSLRRIVEIVGSELGDESAIRGGAALVLHGRAERSDLRPGTRLGALTAHPAAEPRISCGIRLISIRIAPYRAAARPCAHPDVVQCTS